MATLVFQAFAGLNNQLCEDSPMGWLTVPFIPVILGGLNIVLWLCIIVTAIIMYFTTDTSVKERSFSSSFGHALLYWYLALLGVTIIYKLFFCKDTVGATRAFSQLAPTDAQNITSKAVQAVSRL